MNIEAAMDNEERFQKMTAWFDDDETERSFQHGDAAGRLGGDHARQVDRRRPAPRGSQIRLQRLAQRRALGVVVLGVRRALERGVHRVQFVHGGALHCGEVLGERRCQRSEVRRRRAQNLVPHRAVAQAVRGVAVGAERLELRAHLL